MFAPVHVTQHKNIKCLTVLSGNLMMRTLIRCVCYNVTWILFLFVIQSWNRNMVEVRSLVTGKRNYSDQAVRQVWRYIGWLGAWTTMAILVVIIVSSGLAALLTPPTSGTPWQHAPSFLRCIYSAIMGHYWKYLSMKWTLPSAHWPLDSERYWSLNHQKTFTW